MITLGLYFHTEIQLSNEVNVSYYRPPYGHHQFKQPISDTSSRLKQNDMKNMK